LKKILFLLWLSWPLGSLLAQTMPMGQYNIIFNVGIWDPNNHNSGQCKNDFHVYLPINGSYSSIWWVQSGLGNSETFYSDTYTTPAGQAPVIPPNMYTTGSRNYHRLIGGCKGSDDTRGPTENLPQTPCTIQSYINIIQNWSSTMTVQVVPVAVAIQSTSSLLPDADRITVAATQGFAASVYDWQYSTNGTVWTDFPAALNHQSTAVFSGSDLMGNAFQSLIGSATPNTFIRVNYGCGGTYSNMLSLSDRLSSPTILSATGSPNRCFGDANGSISVTLSRSLRPGELLTLFATNTTTNTSMPAQVNVTLGAGNTYTWPQTLPAGNYSISMLGFYPNASYATYSDGTGNTATTSIQSPTAVSYTATKNNDVYCYGGSDGSLGVNASGGVGSYQLGVEAPGQTSYTWTAFGASLSTTLGSLAPGSYLLRVMDGNGCDYKDGSGNEVITTLTIAQPSSPVALDFSQIVNPLAYGSADGSVTAVIKGGTPAPDGSYTTSWTDPSGNAAGTVSNSPLGSTYQTILQDGVNGTYNLQVTDAHYSLAAPGQQAGCLLQQSFTLVQPPPLIVIIGQTRSITCYGTPTAELVAHGQGGIPIPLTEYNYQWYSENNGEQPVGTNDSVLSQVPAGNYVAQITDKNGITKRSDVYTIAQPAPLSITINTTPLACNGDTNGVATGLVSGGTQPYRYNWSTGDTSAVIGGLSVGGYFLFVTDSNGCQSQQTGTVSSPGGLVVDSVVTGPSCAGRCDGSVVLSVTGGSGSYTYAWTPVTGNGSALTGSGSALTGLCSGSYSVQVSDQNGCAVNQGYQLQEPPSVAVNAGGNTTLCAGQVYQANASIADPGATYGWTGPDGFTSSSPTVSLSDTGLYRVTVTNSTGCSGVDSFRLSQISQVISADFVVSTQAFAGQPVTLIDIAIPDPDSIAWQVPVTAGVSILGSDSVSLTVQFADTGSYTIGMKSWLKPCSAVSTQQIVVLSPQVFSNPGTISDPLVASFTVSPNPNSGSFTAQVVLNSTVNIRLRLVNLLSGAVLDDRQLSGLSAYTVSYAMNNIAKGSYFLLLETPQGSTIYEIGIL
jgi:SprB repeat